MLPSCPKWLVLASHSWACLWSWVSIWLSDMHSEWTPLFQPDVGWMLGNAPCCIGPWRGWVQLGCSSSPEQTSQLCLGIPLTPQSRTFTPSLFYKPCQRSKSASFESRGAMQRPRHCGGIPAKDVSTAEAHGGRYLRPHLAKG